MSGAIVRSRLAARAVARTVGIWQAPGLAPRLRARPTSFLGRRCCSSTPAIEVSKVLEGKVQEFELGCQDPRTVKTFLDGGPFKLIKTSKGTAALEWEVGRKAVRLEWLLPNTRSSSSCLSWPGQGDGAQKRLGGEQGHGQKQDEEVDNLEDCDLNQNTPMTVTVEDKTTARGFTAQFCDDRGDRYIEWIQLFANEEEKRSKEFLAGVLALDYDVRSAIEEYIGRMGIFRTTDCFFEALNEDKKRRACLPMARKQLQWLKKASTIFED